MMQEDIKKTLEAKKEALLKDAENIELLSEIADLHVKSQEFGYALNYLNQILEIQPGHQETLLKKEQVSYILRFTNSDIYASTNSNFDPWLE